MLKRKLFLGALSVTGLAPVAAMAISAAAPATEEDAMIAGMRETIDQAKTSFDRLVESQLSPVFTKFQSDHNVELNSKYIEFQKQKMEYAKTSFDEAAKEYKDLSNAPTFIKAGAVERLVQTFVFAINIYSDAQKELDKAKALASVVDKYKVVPTEDETLTEEQQLERRKTQEIYEKLLESLKQTETKQKEERAKKEQYIEGLKAERKERGATDSEIFDLFAESEDEPGNYTFTSAYLQNLSVDFSSKWVDANDELKETKEELTKVNTMAQELDAEKEKLINDLKASKDKVVALETKETDLKAEINKFLEGVGSEERITDNEDTKDGIRRILYHQKQEIEILKNYLAGAQESKGKLATSESKNASLSKEKDTLKEKLDAEHRNKNILVAILSACLAGTLLMLILLLAKFLNKKKEEK